MAINCPNCQFPNPDETQACTACGTSLVEEQFSQALERAMPPQDEAAGPAMASGIPMSGRGDAQAEIDQYLAAEKVRKKKKALKNFAIFAVIAAAIAGFFINKARKDAKLAEIVNFTKAFGKIDNGPVADFWRCAARKKGLDVHKSTDNQILSGQLAKAFELFPKSHPDRMRDRCVPMIDTAVGDFAKMHVPEGFEPSINEQKKTIGALKGAFSPYIDKMVLRKDLAAAEKEIMAAAAAFHSQDPGQMELAAQYVNLLVCAIPDLVKSAKAINKAPDIQPVVEHIFKVCRDDTTYADTLRKTCFPKMKDPKSSDFNIIFNKMTTDDRDVQALNWCFNRANKGFFGAELNNIGKAFVASRNAYKSVLDEVAKYKEH